MEFEMNQGEIIKMQTERVERLIFLEDLKSIKNPSPEDLKLIEKYEKLVEPPKSTTGKISKK